MSGNLFSGLNYFRPTHYVKLGFGPYNYVLFIFLGICGLGPLFVFGPRAMKGHLIKLVGLGPLLVKWGPL